MGSCMVLWMHIKCGRNSRLLTNPLFQFLLVVRQSLLFGLTISLTPTVAEPTWRLGTTLLSRPKGNRNLRSHTTRPSPLSSKTHEAYRTCSKLFAVSILQNRVVRAQWQLQADGPYGVFRSTLSWARSPLNTPRP